LENHLAHTKLANIEMELQRANTNKWKSYKVDDA